jgi:hypothetical protein
MFRIFFAIVALALLCSACNSSGNKKKLTDELRILIDCWSLTSITPEILVALILRSIHLPNTQMF